LQLGEIAMTFALIELGAIILLTASFIFREAVYIAQTNLTIWEEIHYFVLSNIPLQI
jgi:hypothetical protein